jgi:flagellar biosynthesis protein FlhF
MQLRTILARDMREALATMRAEMGEHAVIVGSQKARDGGVIVRAALDHPEEMTTPPDGDTPADVQSSNDAEMPQSIEETHRAALLRRLRGEAAGNTSTTKNFGRAELLSLLRGHRAPESLVNEVACTAEKSGLSDMALALAFALDRQMKSTPIDFTKAHAFLLVGPNGAGKTAVAAKLAAHARLAGQAVKLVATDSSGAGAVARLETFATHLDIPCTVVENAEVLAKTVAVAAKEGVTLIVDTAGFDPRNGKARAAFSALAKIDGMTTLGIVSAAGDAEELSEIVGALTSLGARALVVTGADLVRRLGSLAAAATSSLPLAHVTRSPYISAGLETMTPLSLARALIEGDRADQGSAQ